MQTGKGFRSERHRRNNVLRKGVDIKIGLLGVAADYTVNSQIAFFLSKARIKQYGHRKSVKTAQCTGGCQPLGVICSGMPASGFNFWQNLML